MAIKITTTKDNSKYKKILVYGPSGVGKTMLVKTLDSPLLITSENKSESIADEEIETWIVETIEDFKDCVKRIIKKPKRFKCVCIDSISDIHETAVQHEKPNHKDARKAYGVVQDEMIAILKKIRDCQSIHFYIIAKSKMIQNDEGYDMYSPKLAGQQLGAEIPYLFDFVFPMRIYKDSEENKTYRYLQTNQEFDPKWVAKGSPKLNDQEKPDLQYIINKLSVSKKSKSKKSKSKSKKDK